MWLKYFRITLLRKYPDHVRGLYHDDEPCRLQLLRCSSGLTDVKANSIDISILSKGLDDTCTSPRLLRQ
jgi:hypothetical protein